MCEDLENTEGLHHLYDIFKSIFTLNRVELFEEMFEQDTIFDVVGVLEHDPSSQAHVKHRDYLRTQANFKEVVPFSNQKLLEKIHQTYRMQYIQDVMLPAPSVFEENLLSTLSSLIYFNKSTIVSMIQVQLVQLRDKLRCDCCSVSRDLCATPSCEVHRFFVRVWCRRTTRC